MSNMNPFSMMMGMGQPDQSEEDGDLVPGSSATFPLGVNGGAQNGKNEKKAGKNDKKPPRRKFLDTYCENLTRKAREGKLDDIIGRDREIYRTIQILSRRQKNNPCLIGEAGVGKTAIAEGRRFPEQGSRKVRLMRRTVPDGRAAIESPANHPAKNRSAPQRDLRKHCAQPNRQWRGRQHRRRDPNLRRKARNHGTTNTRPDRNRIHRNQPPAARAARATTRNRCRALRNASCRPNQPHWNPSRAGRGTAGVVEPHYHPRANTARA